MSATWFCVCCMCGAADVVRKAPKLAPKPTGEPAGDALRTDAACITFKVPRTDGGGLFIGGLHALYQRQDLFRQYKISHIVSMLDFDIYEAGHFKDYKHMHVRIDDDPNENMLEHLEATNDFIENALSNGGAVFVHCAMGKSRSATIVVAYLMRKYGKTTDEALAQLCEGRPVCEPNP